MPDHRTQTTEPWIRRILDSMHEDQDATVQAATDFGYEGPSDDAQQVIDHLADTSMSYEEYARIHKLGARLKMGWGLLQANEVPDGAKAEADRLVGFAYDVVDG